MHNFFRHIAWFKLKQNKKTISICIHENKNKKITLIKHKAQNTKEKLCFTVMVNIINVGSTPPSIEKNIMILIHVVL